MGGRAKCKNRRGTDADRSNRTTFDADTAAHRGKHPQPQPQAAPAAQRVPTIEEHSTYAAAARSRINNTCKIAEETPILPEPFHPHHYLPVTGVWSAAPPDSHELIFYDVVKRGKAATPLTQRDQKVQFNQQLQEQYEIFLGEEGMREKITVCTTRDPNRQGFWLTAGHIRLRLDSWESATQVYNAQINPKPGDKVICSATGEYCRVQIVSGAPKVSKEDEFLHTFNFSSQRFYGYAKPI